MKQRDTYLYRVADFLTAMIVWTCFFLIRKSLEDNFEGFSSLHDLNYYYGLIIIPLGWFLFYSLYDDYRDIYRLSRMATVFRTFFLSFFGVLFLFFTLILDDFVKSYHNYYYSFFLLFGLQFFLTVLVRVILLTWAKRRLKAGKIFYKTLIIGGGERAVALYQDIQNSGIGKAYQFAGFITTNEKGSHPLEKITPSLGDLTKLEETLESQQIEEIFIATEANEQDKAKQALNMLFDFGRNIPIKIIPDMYDIILGHVQMNEVYGAVLISIKQELMPKWERLVKRLIDLSVSASVMLVLLPLYLFILLKVRLSSPGPIFYKQERIGYNGKPFHIIKFRSMKVDAEDAGPQLSSEKDPRITSWGHIMRKYRLDELPNFWNVLVGDMSLVGPRPERQFYINQIVKEAPHYRQLLKVRPGVTSWGQVKYGYASNVDEMLQRLKYDVLYIENMSLALDFKIILYTVLVIVQGRGK